MAKYEQQFRAKDPHAALKIFPQSKNIETFNWRIAKDPDGNIIWIFEWYPGAYTPRDGDEGQLVVIKNKNLSKEERIVRATILFDKEGKPIIGLKSEKDHEGNDLPFAFPNKVVDISDLFLRAIIVGNGGGDTIPTNSPFVFIKYIATNPRVRELIEQFEKVHAQFGYADMVVSGMIGPNTSFLMDIDIETPKHKRSDASYIKACLQQRNKNPHKSTSELYGSLATAPILHEFELQLFQQIEIHLANTLHDLFDTANAGYINHNVLHQVITILGISHDDLQLNYYQLCQRKNYIYQLLSRREYEILQSIWNHQNPPTKQNQTNDEAQPKQTRVKMGIAKVRAELDEFRPPTTRPALPGSRTPTTIDVYRARLPRSPKPHKSKTVADL